MKGNGSRAPTSPNHGGPLAAPPFSRGKAAAVGFCGSGSLRVWGFRAFDFKSEPLMFTDTELRQLLYCAAEELRARVRGKRPGPQPWLRDLVRRLELEVAVSSSRHDERCDLQLCEHEIEWIGTTQAASVLGWHERHVQRRATDLDGQKVAGKWIFRATVVRNYAEALNDGRHSA